tara:strand:- start:975 stop:1328 length:354 start_codon:yes stop_codon:yes gene_type:complete
MAAGTIKVDIAGLAGNEAAQPRVFAHSAYQIPTPALTGTQNTYPAPADDTTSTISRGSCIYVGVAGNVKVTMEDKSIVLFKGVTAGSFLPILALKIHGANVGGNGLGTTATDLVALF